MLSFYAFEYVRFWIPSIARGRKFLWFNDKDLLGAEQVKAQKRLPLKKEMDMSSDVWQRLPFWIKELSKMLENSGS